MRAIQIRADKDLRERYRRLLRADWELSDVERCCAVLVSLLETGGMRVSFRDSDDEASETGRTDIFQVPSHFSESLQDFLDRANARALGGDEPREPLPKRRSRERRALADLVIRASFHLVFPDLMPQAGVGRPQVVGDVGIYRDTQSLLFNIAIFELLPSLRAARMAEEEEWLIQILLAHSLIVWQANPSHQQSLRALVFEYLGDVEGSEQALRLAVALTPIGEPDRAAKVQSLWALLTSNGRWREATELLLSEYRAGPESQLEEIRDLLDLTYEGRGFRQAG
jgi:hypothetical protein